MNRVAKIEDAWWCLWCGEDLRGSANRRFCNREHERLHGLDVAASEGRAVECPICGTSFVQKKDRGYCSTACADIGRARNEARKLSIVRELRAAGVPRRQIAERAGIGAGTLNKFCAMLVREERGAA